MRQYLLDGSFHGEKNLTLTGKENQYLVKVLRLKVGDQILGRDRKGKTWNLKLERIEKNSCTLSATATEEGEAVVSIDSLPSYGGPYPRLFLYQCLCKGKKNELIVRQATEIGVEQITLVQSKFCVRDFSNKKESASDRLEGQVKEAIQQSGSPIPTRLDDQILSIEELPQHWQNKGPFIFFHQSERGLSQSLPKLVATIPSGTPVGILIGSEGGLSDEECLFLEEAGFLPALLNTNILRAETAATYALAVVQTLMTETEK